MTKLNTPGIPDDKHADLEGREVVNVRDLAEYNRI